MLDINKQNEIYQLHAEFCKAFSDANRLLIITELSKGELSVNELTRRFGLQQSNVSKHLAFLRENGLVNTRRKGSSIYYNLSDPRIFEAISLLRATQLEVFEKRRKLSRISPELYASIKEAEDANI